MCLQLQSWITFCNVMSIWSNAGPGEDWEYDAVGTKWINHLPRVFANATNGRLPSDVFEKEFRRPLGLSPAFSWKDANKAWDAGSEGTCRDYARFGQLMLNRGQWKGVDLAQPLVSAQRISAAAPAEGEGERPGQA